MPYAERIFKANINQPAINSKPPIGVIAPSQRRPERTRIYKLPEKISKPIEINTAGSWMISEL